MYRKKYRSRSRRRGYAGRRPSRYRVRKTRRRSSRRRTNRGRAGAGRIGYRM